MRRPVSVGAPIEATNGRGDVFWSLVHEQSVDQRIRDPPTVSAKGKTAGSTRFIGAHNERVGS